MNATTIFHAALSKTGEERIRYLDRACKGKPELRATVDALLAAHEKPDNLLDRPLDVVAPTLDSNSTENESDVTSAVTLQSGDSPSAAPESTVTVGIRRDVAEGMVVAGRYTLETKIGEGGMGEVWVAKQSRPVKRKVAVKLIKAGMDSRAVLQRFELERQALALMDHPNISRVLDGGMTPTGQPFFVMELVKGLTLTKFCDEMKLTTRERLELFVPICQAVQHAHQKGIVHRDLKPANILVTVIDGNPVPKVIDFGVAKATSGKLTQETMETGFGAVVGTLEYMSPEQAGFSGDDIDTRADIYSLGVVLYELLTGLRPIDALRLKNAALTEMIRIVREEEPSKPSTRLSTDKALPSVAAMRRTEPKKLTALLRGELDWVVMKCLEKQRDRRYETAGALVRDVQRFLADEVVEARPPSTRYRIQKFIHRNKAMVTAVSAVAMAVLAGAVAFAWQAEVASAERDKAVEALFESREKTARMTYERAQALCEQGNADLGLLWMARSLELTPPRAVDLDRAIRTSINLWAMQLNLIGRKYDAKSDLSLHNVREVAVSPDGFSLLLVDHEGTVRLFDKETGKIRHDLPVADEAIRTYPPFKATFSPDGRFVSVARNDPFARVWEVDSGELVGKPFRHADAVTGVSFVPKSKILVTCAGKKIHFWNIDSGEQEWEPITVEPGNSGVEVSSDGSLLLSWNKSPGQVIVWDLNSRKQLHSLEGINFDVFHAGFSPEAQWVVAAGLEKPSASEQEFNMAQLWEAKTGQPVGSRMRWNSPAASSDFIGRACFRPDGRLLVTGGSPLRMWHVPSGRPLGAVASMVYAERPAFQPDGKQLVAFSHGGTDRFLIDMAPSVLPVPVANQLDGHDQRFAVFLQDAITLSPDASAALVNLYDRESYRLFFRFLNLSTGNTIGELLNEEGYEMDNGWVPFPSFSSDGRSVATVVGTNTCQVFDTRTGQAGSPRIAMESRIMAVALSPDGNLLATGDFDGNVRVWSSVTGRPIGQPLAHKRAISRICFSPDGGKLLVAGGLIRQIYGEARLWDVVTSQPLGPVLDVLGAVRSIAFSPDGKTFATGSFQLILWDTETNQAVWKATSYGITDSLHFTPDGRKLFARHVEENATRMYDVRSGEPTTPYLRHQDQILSSSLSSDGRLILTSSADQTTRLWDASLGLQVGPDLSGPNGGLAALSQNGKSILIIDALSRVMRWDLPLALEGTPERIRLAIEAGTRHSLDTFGAIQFLAPPPQIDPATKRLKPGPDPFEPVEKRLQELGGPPGSLLR